MNIEKLAEAMHDAAIRYANGHTVDFQHEAREVALAQPCAAPADRDLKDWWHAPDGSLHYGDGEQDVPHAAIQHIPHAHKAPFDTVIASVETTA